MSFSADYAVRLARHALVDAVVAPMSEALKSGDLASVLRAGTAVPLTRISALIRYKLLMSRRGMGRPIPRRTWDFEYSGATWAGLDSAEAVPGNMAIANFVRRLCEAPKVLDVGCGTGALAELLQAVPGLTYMGIDLSDVALSRARTRGLSNAGFQQAAMEDWTPTDRYDAIIFNEVIYYVANPVEVLARYREALTPGGTLIISIWRSGNYRLLWQGIEAEYEIVASDTVQTGGVVRDIKMLRKRAVGVECSGA